MKHVFLNSTPVFCFQAFPCFLSSLSPLRGRAEAYSQVFLHLQQRCCGLVGSDASSGQCVFFLTTAPAG